MTGNLTKHAVFFRPIFWVLLGGVGAQIGLRLRAATLSRLGYLPECWKWVAIDFQSDMPRIDGAASSDAPVADVDIDATMFDARELALLQSVPWNGDRLAARIEAGDPEVAWLGDLVPTAILRAYPGGEALAVPAIARAAAAYAVAMEGEESWLAKCRRALESLATDGSGRHSLLQSGVSRNLIDDGPTQVVFVTGMAGGSGRGLLIPVAATCKHLAQKVGQIETHAFVTYGPYRAVDGQEARKAALTYSLMTDLERAMDPGTQIQFPVGASRTIETTGRVFETVGGIDASGRLKHNTPAVVQAAAESLWFQYATRPGFDVAKSRSNIRYQPRVLSSVTEASQ